MCFVLWLIRLFFSGNRVQFFLVGGGMPSLNLETKTEKLTMSRTRFSLQALCFECNDVI